MWLAYDDDNNFGVTAYCKSYMHTAGYNDKHLLVMIGNWSHSHSSGWGKYHNFAFADWCTFGKSAMIPVHQGKKTLSDPMKRLHNDLDSKLIVYNNNPIDKWCLANTAYEEDKNGNIQPHKTSKATRRIDGTAALLDAFTILQQKQEEYESLIH